MPDRDILIVHAAGPAWRDVLGREMRHDLMAPEIEIDPGGIGASFRAAKDFSVEMAGRLQVINREGKVKTGTGRWILLRHDDPFSKGETYHQGAAIGSPCEIAVSLLRAL